MNFKFAIIFGLSMFAVNSTNSLLSTMLPLVTREFGLTAVLAGLIVSTYGWAYAVMQVPVGVISDKRDSRRVMMVALPVLFASTLAFASATTFPLLLASRLMMGLAASFIFVTGLKNIVLRYDPDERGRATGIFLAISASGISVINILAPAAVQYLYLSWRTVYISVSGATILAVVLVVFGLPKVATKAGTVSQRGDGATLMSLIVKVSRSREFWVQNTMAFIYFGSFLGLLFWLPSYFVHSGLGLGYGGLAVSLLGAGSVFGYGISGWLLDRHGRNFVLRAYMSVYTALLAYFVLVPLGRGILPEVMAVSFALGFMSGGTAALIRTIGELFDQESVGTAFGIYNSCCWLGSAFFPVLIGYLLSAGLDFQGSFVSLALFSVLALGVTAVSKAKAQ